MKSLMPKIDSHDGLFHNGNPAAGEQGTRVTDVWLNGVQDCVRDMQAEAHYVLLKAGFTPKKEQQTQLYQAIVKIIDDNRKSASVKQKGEVQLYSGCDSDSEEMAATPKAVKTAYDKAVAAKNVADNAVAIENDAIYQNSSIRIGWLKTSPYGAYLLVDNTNQGRIITNNYLSPLVNSNNNQLPASVAGVKIAYDKGTEAKSAADAAQNTANSAVTKADNAQRAADNANSNANNRVSKSGDTMTGSLTIARASKFYKVGSYNWGKFIDLSGDAVIGNDKCVIGFNNNGALHLGGKPNAAEFNVSIDEERLWVKGDVVTKKGSSLDSAFMKTGGVVTGDTSFKQGDWSGISFFNNSGRYVRMESNPHGANSMMTFVYRESVGSNINVANLPRKDGTILLDSDISHALNSNNKEKVASEFALGELNKKKANLSDFSYQKIGNFEIRKYPDGTMIQTYFVEQYDIRDFKEKSFNWAQSFVDMPLIFADAFSSVNDTHLCGASIRKKSTNATCYYWDYEIGGINQGNVRVQFLAIGRWK